MEQVKKKMYEKMYKNKSVKNFMVQAQNAPFYMGVDWGRMEKLIIAEEGLKMKNQTGVEKLRNRYFVTPTEEIWDAVVKMLRDSGYTEFNCEVCWREGSPDSDGPTYPCIKSNGSLSYTSRKWYDNNSNRYSEMSLAELAEILAQPKHTLMTPEELQKRLKSIKLDEEMAHVLSIEKWERCMKPENWEEICKFPNEYLRGSTCGLCRFHHGPYPVRGLSDCSCCSLNLNNRSTSCINRNHHWTLARAAANDGDRLLFERHGKMMIEIMRNALDKLRKPKEYRLGQLFLIKDEEDGDVLTILGRTDVTHAALISLGEDRGNMWSDSIGKGNGSRSSRDYTQDQIDTMSGNSEAIPVDVEITVKERK